MKTLLSTFAVLGLLTTVALADDPAPAPPPPAPAPPTSPAAENPCAPPPDCAELDGQAQTDCLAQQPPATPPAENPCAPPPEKTGKQMEKSNDNRMESYDSDE
ncbi:MAG: hypothetical protein GXP62_05470 [Oligoflexia bacterium]|nr:hypothetical protein [Oligoflexia bacterium]